jgi:hypothetical protein
MNDRLMPMRSAWANISTISAKGRWFSFELSGHESRANLRRVPSWLGIFAFGSSRGRVDGELSAQGTQFLKPCGGVTHNCGDADHLIGRTRCCRPDNPRAE